MGLKYAVHFKESPLPLYLAFCNTSCLPFPKHISSKTPLEACNFNNPCLSDRGKRSQAKDVKERDYREPKPNQKLTIAPAEIHIINTNYDPPNRTTWQHEPTILVPSRGWTTTTSPSSDTATAPRSLLLRGSASKSKPHRRQRRRASPSRATNTTEFGGALRGRRFGHHGFKIRRQLAPPARLPQRPVRRLHRRQRPKTRQRLAIASGRVWLRLQRRRRVPRAHGEPLRRGQWHSQLPARDAQLKGPVQRRRSQRAGEPERCAGGGYHGQGQASQEHDGGHRRRDPRLLRPRGEDERRLRLDAPAPPRYHEPHAPHGRTHRRRLEGLAGFLRRRVFHLHVRLAVLKTFSTQAVPEGRSVVVRYLQTQLRMRQTPRRRSVMEDEARRGKGRDTPSTAGRRNLRIVYICVYTRGPWSRLKQDMFCMLGVSGVVCLNSHFCSHPDPYVVPLSCTELARVASILNQCPSDGKK